MLYSWREVNAEGAGFHKPFYGDKIPESIN